MKKRDLREHERGGDLENPEDFTKRLLEIINELRKVAGYQIYRNLFLYIHKKLPEREIKAIIPFTITSKKKKNLEINNQFNRGSKRAVP